MRLLPLTKESNSEIVTLTKESNSEIVTLTKESASKTSDSELHTYQRIGMSGIH